MKYIAAYDFGTSGVKLALVNRNGEIIATAQKGYALLTPKPHYVEQDPEEYWSAVCDVTKRALEKAGISPEEIAGIGFGVQAVNVIPVNGDGKLLSNAISWLDSRAEKQAAEINEAIGAQLVRSQDFQCRILWLKETLPALYDETAYFLDCNSYLQFRATGRLVPDDSDPEKFRHNPITEAYLSATLAAAGIDEGKLSPMIRASGRYGLLDQKGAKELGLVPGIPVFGGCIDVPAAAAGAGCLKPGDAHVYLGSSGWLSAMISEPVETSAGAYLLESVDPDYLIYGGCINSCCIAFDWAIRLFYKNEAEQLEKEVYALVEAETAAVEPGSDGLVAAPWLNGEQFPIQDDNARGIFLNISGRHTRAHFVNAMMESICYSLKWQAELFGKDTGRSISSMVANGGGTLSGHWMQMLADILEMPVLVPNESRHSGAVGVALAVGKGLGWCSYDDVKDFIHMERRYLPGEEHRGVYREGYAAFQKLYDCTKELFAALNGGKQEGRA